MDSQSPGNQPLYARDFRSPAAIRDNFRNDFSMRAFLAWRALYSGGRHLHAVMALRYGLEWDPTEFRLHMMLIGTYLALGKKAESERQAEITRLIHPSAEAANLIQEVIDKWQYIPDSVGERPVGGKDEDPLFTTSLLGLDGQFGNQIFQYAFAKLYTEKHGLRFEAYDWIGKSLFGLRDPDVSRILPFILEIEYLRDDPFSVAPAELGILNRDSQGYFQLNTRYLAPYRNRFLSYFKPAPVVEWILQSFLAEIRMQGATLIAIHLRLKDAAGQGRSGAVRIYVEWLAGLWPTLKNPVLFVASDDLEAVRVEFQAFHPMTAEHIRLPMAGIGFYPDFYVLTQADYLAAGNSTFSFAASMLNERAQAFMRPNAENTRLEPYDPWSSFPTVA